VVDAVNSGGMETTHLNTAYEDLRDDARRQLRRGLAAMACREFGGYEKVAASGSDPAHDPSDLQRAAAARFAELLEFMGLDVVPAGRPGYCRRDGCKRPLPMTAASSTGSPSTPHWKRGYCSLKCWTED